VKEFGLIGYPLSHSFSKKYFTEKFEKEGIENNRYDLYPIPQITDLLDLFSNNPNLAGINVTIPYKQEVLQYIDEFDVSAENVGAVNVIKRVNSRLIGYNSDYYGFKQSLVNWCGKTISDKKALVLGTGGSSKAVVAALGSLGIKHISVSRNASNHAISYDDIKRSPDILKTHHIIINTTPLGMSPNVDAKPEIDYILLGKEHYLYDLVYNPEITAFMKAGKARGCNTKNGLEMLHLQAEKSWEIWNA